MSTVHGVLVDSSVLLDIVTEDTQWCAWSSEALATWLEERLFTRKTRDTRFDPGARGRVGTSLLIYTLPQT